MIYKQDIIDLSEPFNIVIIQLIEIIRKVNDEKQSGSLRNQLRNDLTRAEFYLSQTQNYRDFLIQDLNANQTRYTIEGCKQSLRRDQNYYESYVTELNYLL